MKLQGLSVIFTLIVLPLILVLTYYIQLQVNTIDKQNQYDVKLLNSTYGAMSAFEINTANEDLSSVSDSLRTIIEASTNVFMNTLSTNLGMSNASKSYVEPYIPAILYTLYDGYYISAPTRTPKILIDSDGNAVSVGDVGVTISGGAIKFRQVHTSMESQTNCTDCVSTKDASGKVTFCSPGAQNHILYDNCDSNKNKDTEYAYMSATKQASYQIKYSDLTQKESYGQLIYIKKKTNPSAPDTYTTNVDEAEMEIRHMLKTYMPYSARYKDSNFDVTVIYTLDNYVTIQGTLGGIYYTKSGYFIPSDAIIANKTKINGSKSEKIFTYNQNAAKDFIYAGNKVEITLSDGTVLTSGEDGKKYVDLEEEVLTLKTNLDLAQSYIEKYNTLSADALNQIKNEYIGKISSTEFTQKYGTVNTSGGTTYERLVSIKTDLTKKINDRQVKLDKMSSMAYYVTAKIFSDWINENFVKEGALYQIEERDLVEISGQTYKLINGKTEVSHKFNDSKALIFKIDGMSNIDMADLNSPMEIDTDSPFYSHKLNVIRDSIQYNLNLSMSTYNKMLLSAKDYAMPVMQNEEWERILNNVSIVAYMQGYNCGLKTYSNYKIVSSTNNEISVSPKEIYYVEKDNFSNESTEYHRIDCSKLLNIDKTATGKQYISFLSKEVKFDKLLDRKNDTQKYDHKNLACYDCINDGNYKKNKIFDESSPDFTANTNLRKAYHIAIGKARNNLYKMNAIEKSQGYEIITSKSTYGLNKIKTIEIVLNTVKTSDLEENVLNYKVKVGGHEVNSDIYTIVPNVTTKSTLIIDVNQDLGSTTQVSIGASGNLEFINLFEASTVIGDIKDSIEFVKIIYR